MGDEDIVATAAGNFHNGFFKLGAAADVYQGATFFAEYRRRWENEAVGNVIDGDADESAHAGSEARVLVGQGDAQREVFWERPAGSEIHAGGGTDLVDKSVVMAIGNGVDTNVGGLFELHFAALRFFEASGNTKCGGIGELREGSAGRGVISGFVGSGRLHGAGSLIIVFDNDGAVVGGTKSERGELRLIALNLKESGFAPFLLTVEIGGGGNAISFQARFRFGEFLLGIVESELGFLAFDDGKDFLFLRFHARGFDVEARFHNVGLILLLFHVGGDFGLLDFGVGGFQGGLILSEILLEGGGVEFHDDITLFHFGAAGNDVQDLQVAGAGGSRDGDGLKGFHGAAQFGVFDEFLALHLGGGNLGSRARKTNDTENKKSRDERSYREERTIAAKSR